MPTGDVTDYGVSGITGYAGNQCVRYNYVTDEQYAAPFRYVDGAEISNLRVAGAIKTSKKFASGFIANAKGSTSLTNCRSSVTINSSVNGDGTHGGFVGNCQNNDDDATTVTFTRCAFDGRVVGAGPVPARLPKGLYIHNGRKVLVP